jgi:hypothetical protein
LDRLFDATNAPSNATVEEDSEVEGTTGADIVDEE